VRTFTLDYVLLTGGNSLTRFMRFGSGFANNYRGPPIESLGRGARLLIHNIVHAVCVFFQRCVPATKCFSSEFQNSPELNTFKNYKKKCPPYICVFLQTTTGGFGTLQAHRDTESWRRRTEDVQWAKAGRCGLYRHYSSRPIGWCQRCSCI